MNHANSNIAPLTKRGDKRRLMRYSARIMSDETLEPPRPALPHESGPLPKPVAEPLAPTPPNALTPEEQMALFEKELKENDWGHQPC